MLLRALGPLSSPQLDMPTLPLASSEHSLRLVSPCEPVESRCALDDGLEVAAVLPKPLELGSFKRVAFALPADT